MADRSTFAEARLLYREAPKENPEAKEKPKEKEPVAKEAERKVKDEVAKVAEKVKAAVPETAPSEPEEEEELPKPIFTREGLMTVPKPNVQRLKAGAVAASLAVVPFAAGPALALYKAYKWSAKYPPMRWVDTGVRRGASAVGTGIKGIAETAAYLPRVATALTVDTAIMGKRIAGRTLNVITSPLRAVLGRSFNMVKGMRVPKFEGSRGFFGNLFNDTVDAAATVVKSVTGVAESLLKHPIRTAIAAIIATSLYTDATGTIAFSKGIVQTAAETVSAILKGIIKIKGG